MQVRRDTADNDKINAAVAKCLNRRRELHQECLRAMPRICSNAVAASSRRRARSAGVSRNCEMSSVKSIP